MSAGLNSILLGELMARLQQIRRETVGLTDTEARALAAAMEKEARLIAGLAAGPVTPAIHTAQTIIATAAAEWGVDATEITGGLRRADVAAARFAAYGLLRLCRPNISSQSAAKAMGVCDHSSVLYAWKRCQELRETDPDFAGRYRSAVAALSTASQPTQPTP